MPSYFGGVHCQSLVVEEPVCILVSATLGGGGGRTKMGCTGGRNKERWEKLEEVKKGSRVLRGPRREPKKTATFHRCDSFFYPAAGGDYLLSEHICFCP